jgi:cytochrome b561
MTLCKKEITMVKKYSNAIASIHWIHAGLLMFLLLSGGLILSNMPNNADKLDSIKIHMILGFVAGLITLIRLYMVARSPELEPLKVDALRSQVIKWNHRFLYLMMFVVVLSGMAAANGAGIGEIVFFGQEGELYANVTAVGEVAHTVHAVATKLFMALIVMHVAGIVSYLLKTKENVLRRVGFGQP